MAAAHDAGAHLDTVNTIPEKTLPAFADHRKAEKVMQADSAEADMPPTALSQKSIDEGALNS